MCSGISKKTCANKELEQVSQTRINATYCKSAAGARRSAPQTVLERRQSFASSAFAFSRAASIDLIFSSS